MMVHLDRLLTIGLFGPLSRLSGGKQRGIPVLMYHSISRDLEEGIHPYFRLSTTPETFAMHMALLAEQGYQVIGLEEAITTLRSGQTWGGSSSARQVVITFDDGFLDFHAEAFPILSERCYPATVFLPTALVGKQEGLVRGKPFLSWGQVRELSAMNVTFGSHSVSHRHLVSMQPSEVKEELKRSKECIEEETGRLVTTFSHPYAFPEHRRGFSRFLRATLEELGYVCAVTTSIGTATPKRDLFFLRRLPVSDADDDRLFASKIAGAYDWLHGIQFVSKYVRGLLRPGLALERFDKGSDAGLGDR